MNREGAYDAETIKFESNDDFSYYCAYGNAVDDSDLYEVYSYNENTKKIKLDCFKTIYESITIKYDKNSL